MTFTLQPKSKLLKQEFPSQPILLYGNDAELTNGENTILGEALIQIYWYPFPHISVKFVGEDPSKNIKLNLDNSELKLTQINLAPKMKFMVRNRVIYGTGKTEIFGYLKEPFIQGRKDNLSSVTFQIANFFQFDITNDRDFKYEYDEQGYKTIVEGSLIFEYDDWHIVLATLPYLSKFQKTLEALGGYGIAHTCKVKHSDGKTFDLNQGYEIINAFIYYISFVRGIWIAPLYVLGFDVEGNQILEEWRTPTIKADSWQPLSSPWIRDSVDTIKIVDAFPGFMKKWQDETWQEVIQNSIQWYIESYKHTNGYNTSIILVHSALEKLAWTYLNSNDYISSEGFGKLTFDDKLRLLIKTLDISLLPLDKNWEITKLAKERNKDNVSIIGYVRNLLIHPKTKNTENKIKLTESMMGEVFFIAHNYLLKCLLKLFDYPYGIDTF